MRDPTSKSLHARIDTLPLCRGTRTSLSNELEYAERFADDLLAATRTVQALVARLGRFVWQRWPDDKAPRRRRPAV
jgi:hypothetical protein